MVRQIQVFAGFNDEGHPPDATDGNAQLSRFVGPTDALAENFFAVAENDKLAVAPAGGLVINADRRRWSPLSRIAWFASSVYHVIRDESDRQLLRDWLIHGRLDDLEDREIERWLNEKVALPHREDLQRALDELSDLSEIQAGTVGRPILRRGDCPCLRRPLTCACDD